MKKFLKTTLHIGIGFIFGVITISYLSMRASPSFLEMVRINYQLEQEIMAIRAKKNGNMNKAILHYSNLVSASSSPGLYCFNKNRKYWSMDFPITSLALEEIVSSMRTNSGEKKQEGENRALLADALEKTGRRKEATSEYIKASNLLGCDIEKVKKIARIHMEYDERLLELQDQYTYPQNLMEKPIRP
jgi:hypothetical protein